MCAARQLQKRRVKRWSAPAWKASWRGVVACATRRASATASLPPVARTPPGPPRQREARLSGAPARRFPESGSEVPDHAGLIQEQSGIFFSIRARSANRNPGSTRALIDPGRLQDQSWIFSSEPDLSERGVKLDPISKELRVAHRSHAPWGENEFRPALSSDGPRTPRGTRAGQLGSEPRGPALAGVTKGEMQGGRSSLSLR